MHCIRRPIFTKTAVVGLALVLAGCSSEQTAVEDGGVEVYVPGSTPVVRATLGDDSRQVLGSSETVLLTLGTAVADSATQHQLAVDRSGDVFILDVFAGSLSGYGPDGDPLPGIGSVADGLVLDPAPLTIGTVSDTVVLGNAFPGRLRRVTRAGEIVADVELSVSPWRPHGLSDETFVALEFETGVVGRYDVNGNELARYTVFKFREGELGGDLDLWAQQTFAVGTDRVYVTTAETHQVSAYGLDGESTWVLEGTAERTAIPDNISGRTLGRSRRAGRAAGATLDTDYADVIWPEFYPALKTIATDADGRLYVFPYVIEANPALYPVDVYDADGNEIVRGWLPFQGWDAHSGNSVYRVETRDGMNVVVRYELTLPSPGTAAAQ